jgi:hypothetical protein
MPAGTLTIQAEAPPFRPATPIYAWTLAGCVLSTLLTAVLFSLYREVNVWEGLRAAKALESPVPSDPVFLNSIFRTRANAWSNLVYVYVGIFALVAAGFDWRRRARGNYLLETPAVGAFFGLSSVYLGIGSGIFHASLTWWGQQLDVAAMYSTLVALIALNLGRLRPYTRANGGLPTWPLWILIAVIADTLLYIYKWEMRSGTMLPALILCVVAFMLVDRLRQSTRVNNNWLIAAFVSLVLAVACRRLDVVGPLAKPEVWLTGHALWHGYTAAALGCSYLYYRTEQAARK